MTEKAVMTTVEELPTSVIPKECEESFLEADLFTTLRSVSI